MEKKPLCIYDGAIKELAADDTLPISVHLGWYDGGAFTRASDATFTVTDNAGNQSAYTPGRPIRYRSTAGTWRYGVVTAYASGSVTLSGAPLTTSDDDEIQYGDFGKITVFEIGMIAGTFAESASTALLAVNNIWMDWKVGPAFLVRFRVRVGTDDSGASQPRVNVSISGAKVGTANSNAGLSVAESWSDSGTGISTANYDIAFGNVIEVTTDAAGTNNDAENLYISMILVNV